MKDKPAFPCRIPGEPKTSPNGMMCQNDTVQSGITMRDYFAAKAMNSLVKEFFDFEEHDVDHAEMCEFIAKNSYDLADAMLKAREK